MTQKLTEFLTIANNKKYATQNGTRIHTMLKNIVIDSTCANRGNIDIINQIKQRPNLCKYFAANAQTEVPIAVGALVEVAQTGDAQFQQALRIDGEANQAVASGAEQFLRRGDALDDGDVGHLPTTVGQIHGKRRLAGT